MEKGFVNMSKWHYINFKYTYLWQDLLPDGWKGNWIITFESIHKRLILYIDFTLYDMYNVICILVEKLVNYGQCYKNL